MSPRHGTFLPSSITSLYLPAADACSFCRAQVPRIPRHFQIDGLLLVHYRRRFRENIVSSLAAAAVAAVRRRGVVSCSRRRCRCRHCRRCLSASQLQVFSSLRFCRSPRHLIFHALTHCTVPALLFALRPLSARAKAAEGESSVFYELSHLFMRLSAPLAVCQRSFFQRSPSFVYAFLLFTC